MAGKIAIALLVVIGIAAVAAADHWGAGIYAGPLYYLPLALAAWQLSRGAALTAAILATFAWAIVSFEAGSPFTEPVLWTINLLLQGSVFLLVTWLIATLRQALHRARENRSTDELTGLSTRRSFYERAGSVLSVCHRDMRPVSLAHIEIDNLEQLRSGWFNRRGERVLRELADAITEVMRASDIAARLDENEFVVLLPETNGRHAQKALDKLRNEILSRQAIRDNEVHVRIGATAFSPAPADITSMLRAAERLLHRVKAAAPDSVVVEAVDQFHTRDHDTQPGDVTGTRARSRDERQEPRLH